MLAVLDTNHFRELAFATPLGTRLEERADAAGADLVLTIITVQEATAGWLALINSTKAGRGQIRAYERFQATIAAFDAFAILPFDDAAADHFEGFQNQRLRIGTMDLKIAAICLAHDATLLTRNRGDFEKIPGLRVDNWLD
ncbi:hypothetical protein LBMAG56_38240 [Verrucomicrobiota bacterium]|nr:hypothetical protein LBMAG56_38240 [Verrucomicrobiota bacterium]